MIKITLDTNALRDLAWSKGFTNESRYGNDQNKKRRILELFNRLYTIRDRGDCEIGVTTQLYRDYSISNGKLPKKLEELIGQYVDISLPSVSTFPWVFPTKFPNQEEYAGIFEDTFPHSIPEHKKYQDNQKDAWQLYAHRVAERDIFITADNTILNNRTILNDKWNIQVKSLEEFVSNYNYDV